MSDLDAAKEVSTGEGGGIGGGVTWRPSLSSFPPANSPGGGTLLVCLGTVPCAARSCRDSKESRCRLPPLSL